MFRFSETESFDLSAALHAELGADGWWYAVGDGLLVPCESKKEVEQLIGARRNRQLAQRFVRRQPAVEMTSHIRFNVQDDSSEHWQPTETGTEYALAITLTALRRLLSSA